MIDANGNITLYELGITQHNIRNLDQVPAMIEHVSGGGYFDDEALAEYARQEGIRKAPIMEIAKFEDGHMVIHNGHHRAIAVWLGGRDHISQTEYYIRDWKYTDYEDIVTHREDGTWMGWVTPFDVLTESRICDLTEFKDAVKAIHDAEGPDAIKDYIEQNRHQYAKEKTLHNVPELSCELLSNGLGKKIDKAEVIIGSRGEECRLILPK